MFIGPKNPLSFLHGSPFRCAVHSFFSISTSLSVVIEKFEQHWNVGMHCNNYVTLDIASCLLFNLFLCCYFVGIWLTIITILLWNRSTQQHTTKTLWVYMAVEWIVNRDKYYMKKSTRRTVEEKRWNKIESERKRQRWRRTPTSSSTEPRVISVDHNQHTIMNTIIKWLPFHSDQRVALFPLRLAMFNQFD